MCVNLNWLKTDVFLGLLIYFLFKLYCLASYLFNFPRSLVRRISRIEPQLQDTRRELYLTQTNSTTLWTGCIPGFICFQSLILLWWSMRYLGRMICKIASCLLSERQREGRSSSVTLLRAAWRALVQGWDLLSGNPCRWLSKMVLGWVCICLGLTLPSVTSHGCHLADHVYIPISACYALPTLGHFFSNQKFKC